MDLDIGAPYVRPMLKYVLPFFFLITHAHAESPIIAEADHWLGSRNPTGLRAQWCGAFVSFVLRQTGRRPLPGSDVWSAMRYGPRTAAPKPGDLIIMRRHVGFYEGRGPDGIYMLSGNWGHRVARSVISPRQVVTYIDVH